MSALTVERLRELLSYDPDTGVFTWRVTKSNRANKGSTAGHRCKVHREITIRIDGRNYRASRLAWLYTRGQWPENLIDHINGDRLDNRLGNLRDVTGAEQAKNMPRSSANTTGVTGTSFNKRTQRYEAYITSRGFRRGLGHHRTLEGARLARKEAECKLGFHPNHGREAVR